MIRKELRKLKKKGKGEEKEAMKLKKIMGKNKGDLKRSKRSKKMIEAKRKVRKDMEVNGYVNKSSKFFLIFF